MRIVESLPSTGYQRPTADQLRELLRRVRSEYEWLPPIEEAEFARAMFAVGFQFRLSDPDASLHFQSHVDHCNNFLARWGRRDDCDGNSIFSSVVAHGDVVWRAANPAKGQLLEVALNPYTGRPCTNRWRDLLAGAPLRQPLGPKGIIRAPSDAIPRPKYYQEDARGEMREFDPAPLWMR